MARKILLADDSVTAQNMGRKILADAGYEVITVNNGSAALKKIAEAKPDLIVLDVYMPGYSGLEVCQRLKEAQETARVPVLLTVGKLEPFKPEEAKRVRADGFIVKPFEASELLSALSKLEDKIVPRAEPSKPGRFARATAALDEGRYDKTVSVDEDSGWRNRIQFPPKKKETAAQEDGDDPAVYNAMNKDLRTVVEHKVAEQPHEAKAKETRVDLGALAPEGLPKDVTPEEIAALAAAAAQVKGKIAESKSEAEVKTEQSAEAAQPAQPALEAPQEVPASQVATFAEQKSEEKIDVPAEKPSEFPIEAASSPASRPADVMAAISGLEAEAGTSRSTSSGNGSWLHGAPSHTADEPVTMAAAAGAQSSAVVSRWTAVSVALAPEEAAISLEHEMQKAYAAFAAAETGHVEHTTAPQETPSTAMETASPDAIAATEPVVPVPATPAPEVVQALSEVASAATDAISAAVKELEAVAASYEQQMPAAPAEPESAPTEKITEAEAKSPETPVAVVETSPVAPAEEMATPKLEAAQPEVAEVAPSEEPKAQAETSDTPVPTPVEEVRTEESSAVSVSEVAAPINGQPDSESSADAVNGESDAAESTAAAWASWHRTRESGTPGAASEELAPKGAEEAPAPEDAAARAVAAGAEKTPEEASAPSDSDEGIASIVDSVLAEMRPKIYEEISRKMGKKK